MSVTYIYPGLNAMTIGDSSRMSQSSIVSLVHRESSGAIPSSKLKGTKVNGDDDNDSANRDCHSVVLLFYYFYHI